MKLFNNYNLCPYAMVRHNGRKLTPTERKVLFKFGSDYRRAGRYYCLLSDELCPGECDKKVSK